MFCYSNTVIHSDDFLIGTFSYGGSNPSPLSIPQNENGSQIHLKEFIRDLRLTAALKALNSLGYSDYQALEILGAIARCGGVA